MLNGNEHGNGVCERESVTRRSAAWDCRVRRLNFPETKSIICTNNICYAHFARYGLRVCACKLREAVCVCVCVCSDYNATAHQFSGDLPIRFAVMRQFRYGALERPSRTLWPQLRFTFADENLYIFNGFGNAS